MGIVCLAEDDSHDLSGFIFSEKKKKKKKYVYIFECCLQLL